MANIYREAIEAWGDEAQLGMVQEECAELIKAINKYFRGVCTKVEIIEECVDVELMINQMRELFKDDSPVWENFKQNKLERLKKLLDNR